MSWVYERWLKGPQLTKNQKQLYINGSWNNTYSLSDKPYSYSLNADYRAVAERLSFNNAIKFFKGGRNIHVRRSVRRKFWKWPWC